MKNMWAPWRMTYINGPDFQGTSQECIFCVDEGREGPDKARLILYTDRLSMVMMNRFPYNNCHLLVAPRRHIGQLSDLSKEEMGDLLSLVTISIDILRQHAAPDGFNVGLNLGRVAGAGVEDHLHFHVVPRWNGDTNFMTVFDDVRVVPEHLEATFDQLIKYFNKLT